MRLIEIGYCFRFHIARCCNSNEPALLTLFWLAEADTIQVVLKELIVDHLLTSHASNAYLRYQN